MSTELDIFNAVMNVLKNDPNLKAITHYYYEGRRENVPYAQFPCLMLWIDHISVESRRHDHERLVMRFGVAYYISKWDATGMFTNQSTGLIRVYNLIDHALAQAQNSNPPFGLSDRAIIVEGVGDATFPVIVDLASYPFMGVEFSFDIGYVKLNSER